MISLLFSAWQQSALAQNKHGFVQQENIRVAGITTDAQIATLNNLQKQTSRVYTDGMGRTLQTVGVDASPLQNDIIQPVAYDNLGRQTTSYLPYAGLATDTLGSFRANALTSAQAAFYNQTSQYLIAKDANPYTQQVFENSPLQRLLQSGMVGNGFQPVAGQHYKTVSYRYNNVTQDGSILVWNPDGTFTTSNFYADNKLSVTDGKDEDNIETLSFTDAAGRIVLKRQIKSGGNLDTYYVYNLAGMLVYTIPPLATVKLAANSYNLATAPLKNLVFHMVYDNLGRLVEKTIPAKGTMYVVYDPLNRPVLMQDASMLAANKWNYIKYDAQGRAASQGIYADATHVGRVAMQTYVSGLTGYNTAWFESRQATISNGGYYTNSIFPTTGLTPLAYAYYDDYDMNMNGTADFGYKTQGLTGEGVPTAAKLKGVPTMVSTTTVGAGLSATWLTSVTFYDKWGNPIQSRSNNHLYHPGDTVLTDTKTSVPDFTGVPQLSQVVKQTGASTSIKVLTGFTYDHMNRVTTIKQQYNGTGSLQAVASYSYNELGQVIKKGLGYVNATTWLQNVDMRYNIRGQLLSINNSKLANDAGVTNSDANDVFGMQMLYDQVDANLSNTGYFNGKLSGVKWMSKDGSGNSSYERAYKYGYDDVGRYTSSAYAERTTAGTGTFNNNVGGFNENVTYANENGNITALTRNSSTQGTNANIQVDNLTYTYDSTNPNQLQKVTDGTGANYTGLGFRNLTGSTANYSYDVNGNLTADPYKGLSAIAYNVLNRTDKISFTSSANRYIDYTYDAGGTLLKKRQYDNVGGVATLQNTTDYVDGFVYLNGTLQYFAIPEGRVLNVSGSLKQEFVIADQQGNARVSFQDSGTGTALVKQENSYYAFGLVMANSPVTTPTTPNKQLYNGGSEWQNDYANLPDYYQTFNRNYDPAIGRFVGVDPVAESADGMTTYQYANNNPVMYNDPLGDLAKLPIDIPVCVNCDIHTNKKSSTDDSDFGGIPDWARSSDFGGSGGASNSYGAFWSAIFGSANAYIGANYSADVHLDGSMMSSLYHNYHGNSDAINNALADNDQSAAAQSLLLTGGYYGPNNSPVTIDGKNGSFAEQNSYVIVAYRGGSAGNSGANQVDGPTFSQYLANWGIGAATLENFAGKAQLGNGLKVYLPTATGRVFMGNQYVKTLGLAKTGKALGIAGAAVGVGLDIRGMFIYRSNPNAEGAVSPGKFGADAFMTGAGFTGFGTLPSLFYFGIDAYYPGGFPAAMKNAAPVYNQINQPTTFITNP